MQPALPLPQTIEALGQKAPRLRRVALRKPRAAEPVVEKAEKEEAPAVVAAAKPEKDPALTGIPELRLGPGPAFAMSLRLSPAMQEAVSPPTSACVIEQTFNQLFPPPEGLDRLATLRRQVTPKPLVLVAIKTGTTGALDAATDHSGVTVGAAEAAASAPQVQ